MERRLTNGVPVPSSDFLHPLSPPHHHQVRRLSPNYVVERSASPSARRRRRQRKPWRKLLWVKQDYPDNWTDNSFLEELQRNVNIKAYAFYPLIASTTHLTQHLSSLTIFITAFIGIYTNRLAPSALSLTSSLVTILAYIFWDFTSNQSKLVNIPSTVKSAGLIFFTLLGLSPVLKSLTKSTTSDSIWALSVGLFCVEIMAHDYSSASWKNIKFPTSLSLNLAILSSVVLASRLPSTTTVFSYLLFSVQWFALFPLFRRYLLQYSPIAFHTLTVILFLSGVACVAWIGRGNWLAGAVWGALVGGGVGIGCPLGLIWLQKYKNKIHGPWDVARPRFKDVPQ